MNCSDSHSTPQLWSGIYGIAAPWNYDYAVFMLIISLVFTTGSVYQTIWLALLEDHEAARGLSPITVVIQIMSQAFWTYYGLMLPDLAVFLSSLIPFVFFSIMACLIWYHKRQTKLNWTQWTFYRTVDKKKPAEVEKRDSSKKKLLTSVTRTDSNESSLFDHNSSQ
jgi:hypothetical protein